MISHHSMGAVAARFNYILIQIKSIPRCTGDAFVVTAVIQQYRLIVWKKS
jgi:hypothetical protein